MAALYSMHTNHLGNVTALGDTTGGLVTGSAARYNLFGNYRTTPTTDAEGDSPLLI